MGSTGSLIADLIGVAVFAASGASAGVAKRFDIFGVIFVGTIAALGGGIVRDLLIGAIPPYAFMHWLYLVVAVLASALLFALHPQFDRLRRVVLVFDAAGLGLFSATGTLRARDAGVPVLGACVIGMIAGIGGGLGRDLLTGEIPIVLRREIYAVASLFGAAVVLGLVALHTSRPVAVAITAAAVFAVRMLALRRKWSAPIARDHGLLGPTPHLPTPHLPTPHLPTPHLPGQHLPGQHLPGQLPTAQSNLQETRHITHETGAPTPVVPIAGGDPG